MRTRFPTMLATLATLPFASACAAQPGDDFLAPYGLENFSPHYRDALNSYLTAQDAFDSDDLAASKAILDDLWAQYPVGDLAWAALPAQPFGLNLGTPTCYYALRMLTDLTNRRLDHPEQPAPARTANLTVVLVGATQGIEPRNFSELNNGAGINAVHTLDPRLTSNQQQIIDESLHLFTEYIQAVTQGRLDVQTTILTLPGVTLPVVARASPSRYAGLQNAGQVFEHIPSQTLESTDWWWVIYPSHVPEQYPEFSTTEFVTGGMGLGPNASPLFIIDDRWLVRKPPHLGLGDYHPVERKAYLPQWLQHEFFHHLFRLWPEFNLEESGHQWFNRSTWPSDFTGSFEPDYYHEALFKRLHHADPQPHVALRNSTAGAPHHNLTLDNVAGSYYRIPITNPWHPGRIELNNGQPRWRNNAGVSWSLTDDLANGRLATGPDNPYQGTLGAEQFTIALQREPVFGDITAEPLGFTFINELYTAECALTPAQALSVIQSPFTDGSLDDPCPPPCPADTNNDGVLDNGDIGAFVTLFLAGDLAADFNADGILDNGDISAFVTAFLAGC